jgi:hypothetical protein
MTSYRTCRNCAFEREDCDRRATVAAGIKGLGITSLKFGCTLRQPKFRPGQRVEVTWTYYDPDAYWEERACLESWPATVARETSKGFLIVVDDVESGTGLPAREYVKSENLFCNVAAGKLKPLNEPDRKVCGFCHNPEDGKGGVSGNCWGRSEDLNYAFTDKCLASGIEAPSGVETGNTDSTEGESPAREAGDAQ